MISIIVPIYNTEQYLKQCVDSILNQSFNDIDVVLIDDGSSDNCGAICDNYSTNDPRIRVYHIENCGIAKVRNIGLKHAREKKAEFILFVDSDDFLEPDIVEKLHAAIENNDADIAVCGWSRDFVNDLEILRLEDREYDHNQAMRTMLSGDFRFALWNKLWKLSLFDDIEFPDKACSEDVRITYKVMDKAKKVVSVYDTFYHYRQRHSSIIHTPSAKRLLERWEAAEEIFDYCESGPYRCDSQVRLSRLDYCAFVVVIVWENINACPRAERKEAMPELKRIAAFIRSHFSRGGLKGWRFTRKAVMLLTRRATRLNFALAALLSKVYKKSQRGKQLFD